MGAARVTGGYQVVLEELHAAPLREGGSGGRYGISTSSLFGGSKETVGVVFTSSVFPYPPLSHSLFVALFANVSSLLGLWARI